MDCLNPVYTEKTECQDCAKCVRNCPVKAIKMENSSAAIVPEHCILCGNCVSVCPTGAKKIRDDLSRARRIVDKTREDLNENRPRIIASLAPSWVSSFQGISPQAMVKALESLGFDTVSETSTGAEALSLACAKFLEKKQSGIFISSACPSAVRMITRYYPKLTDLIIPLPSPVIVHTMGLKKIFGTNSRIIFINPCIAKKEEADNHPELMDVSITFNDLKKWLKSAGLDLEKIDNSGFDNSGFDNSVSHTFFPNGLDKGLLYPVEGGMNENILQYLESRGNMKTSDIQFMSFSGSLTLIDLFEEISKGLFQNSGKNRYLKDQFLFLELLMCENGCINGPGTVKGSNIAKKSAVKKRLEDSRRLYAESSKDQPNQFTPESWLKSIEESLEYVFTPKEVEADNYSEEQINKELLKIGKECKKDELNCSSCGYASCRDFARALLSGKAETSMCVSYMRKLASNKADALIKTMPSGVVIVNSKLKIIECNRPFAELAGPEAVHIFGSRPGLKDAKLSRIIPFYYLFEEALLDNPNNHETKDDPDVLMDETGRKIWEKELKHNNKILKVTIFHVDENRILGGIVQDVTLPAGKRENIINKTEQVITKNLQTVQKIAYLLGENAAESEIVLNSIIESFGGEIEDQE